jgi:peptidyl-prolyl cis-trans isomerase A (cyclophilin A)
MATNQADKAVSVVLATSEGDVTLELNAEKAPLSVSNFLAYADVGFYSNTVFHRVIPNFMIQGGGFTSDLQQKPTRPPIKNEAANGLKNDRGTIAMARTPVVDSATAQFFINLKNNDFLNHGGRDYGYAVFGKVTAGMDVVDKIAAVETTIQHGMRDVPAAAVVIKSVRRQ